MFILKIKMLIRGVKTNNTRFVHLLSVFDVLEQLIAYIIECCPLARY